MLWHHSPNVAVLTFLMWQLQNVVATVELPDAGLVLEVADSAVVEGDRGLFIRCMPVLEEIRDPASAPTNT